jgi:hypothetical protein
VICPACRHDNPDRATSRRPSRISGDCGVSSRGLARQPALDIGACQD